MYILFKSIRYSSVLIIIIITLFICSSAKNIPVNNNVQKPKDTLLILKPYVIVYAEINGKSEVDSSLSKTNSELIKSAVINLLEYKYKLIISDSVEIDEDTLIKKLDELEIKSKSSKNVSSKTIFKKYNDVTKSKYALLLLLNADYNPRYQPNYNTYNNAMGSNSISYNAAAQAHCDMRYFIIDTQTEQIISYDKKKSLSTDPRVAGQVEQLTKTLLKGVYYKSWKK